MLLNKQTRVYSGADFEMVFCDITTMLIIEPAAITVKATNINSINLTQQRWSELATPYRLPSFTGNTLQTPQPPGNLRNSSVNGPQFRESYMIVQDSFDQRYHPPCHRRGKSDSQYYLSGLVNTLEVISISGAWSEKFFFR